MRMDMGIKIFIADDNRIFREGVCLCIERVPDMEIVGQAGDPQTVLQLVRQLSPDVIIMDLNLPGMNISELIRKIISDRPSLKVITVAEHFELHPVLAALKSGASGYLLKSCSAEALEHTIRAVMDNITCSFSEAVVIGVDR